ncbi:nucleotide sugar dehydrogenase [Prochlorococcus sp. MIT 1011]|uniref:nucleotide sugar dehydrogenase n=1 Tax=Prochlorococcus sp. MIT 1011 TaxID=3082520 RepID=UPI0039B60584
MRQKNPLNYPDIFNCNIVVVGLGYVGLPLAVEFASVKSCIKSKKIINRKVIGYDINQKRILDLKKGFDDTKEISFDKLKSASSLEFTNTEDRLSDGDVFLVTVPTPINEAKIPDLSIVKKASIEIGKALKIRKEKRDKNNNYKIPIVIFESTVYPGATEELCVPILEQGSGLKFNEEFMCGYSPERINPGDSEHTISSIIKVTSGCNPEAANWIDDFYSSIIKAGTFLAPSIKVAEAAKVIENTQRDINIALVNEFAIIFEKMNIDTLDVLEAASTKWNFLDFKPGLVGGHCIGVDPYYLTYKAQKLNYHPDMVLAGRRINDRMASWIIEQIVLDLTKKRLTVGGETVLILGFTFKENCTDIRNTKVIDLIKTINKYGMKSHVVDPLASAKETENEYGITIHKDLPEERKFIAAILAVPHKEFLAIDSSKLLNSIYDDGIFFDLKGVLPRNKNISRI